MTNTDGWTQTDREQIEQVFALTGGELMDVPWVATDADGHAWTFHFWYEFPPEYTERQEFDSTAHSYRTVVKDIILGATPDRLDGWSKVATYTSSGETECPGRNEEPNIVTDDECYLCGAEHGQEHGYIYIGDGWAEIVYQEDEQDGGQE